VAFNAVICSKLKRLRATGGWVGPELDVTGR
jgi:hypothetical protein